MAKKANKPRKKKSRPNGPKHSSPNVIEYSFGADFLQGAGPVMLASWWLPEALRMQLRAEGKNVPDPVSGLLLVDTGASGSCIDDQVARDLGLLPVRIGRSHGVHGEADVNVYNALLHIAISDGSAQKEYFREGETMGVVGISDSYPEVDFHGEKRRLVGLLGRDVLRNTKFNYDGVNGKLRMVFCD